MAVQVTSNVKNNYMKYKEFIFELMCGII